MEGKQKELEVKKEVLLIYLKSLLTALILDVSAVVGVSYKEGTAKLGWELLGCLSVLILVLSIRKVSKQLEKVGEEFAKLEEK